MARAESLMEEGDCPSAHPMALSEIALAPAV
jgi:hypothetical protein